MAGRERDRDRARRESGVPGGGAGRRDEVGGSGVYPASAGGAPAGAEVRTQAGWGQGERGAAGYEDSGRSELHLTEAELRAAAGSSRTEETDGSPRGDAGHEGHGSKQSEREE